MGCDCCTALRATLQRERKELVTCKARAASTTERARTQKVLNDKMVKNQRTALDAVLRFYGWLDFFIRKRSRAPKEVREWWERVQPHAKEIALVCIDEYSKPDLSARAKHSMKERAEGSKRMGAAR